MTVADGRAAIETRLAHAAADGAPPARTVNPAIQRGSTVLLPDTASLYRAPVTYGRAGLATHDALRAGLCALEDAADVRLYPSGQAAMAGTLLALLRAGDAVLASDGVYGPTRRLLDVVLRRFGVAVTYYPADADSVALAALAGPDTRLLVLESPSSLTFEVQDTPALTRLARERGWLTVMDNTWAAGLLFRPLDHGVGVSLQALTKYVSGGSDLFMGAAATRDPALAARLGETEWDLGWSVGADDAYAMLRGLRSLPVRLARHGASGLAVAGWLRDQPEVLQVLHPGLPGAPGHDLWRRDFTGACGLFGVVLRPGGQVAAMLDGLRLFGLGFSWGGFESLAIACDPQLRRVAGGARVGGPLVRLHVGLEEPADLIDDLRAGLDRYAVTLPG